MGLHYVNGDLVNKGVIDDTPPQIVIYEPTPNGRSKLTGADYLVFADTWNAKHSSPPELIGQLFHLFDAPNRFGLPAFYTLHEWASSIRELTSRSILRVIRRRDHELKKGKC